MFKYRIRNNWLQCTGKYTCTSFVYLSWDGHIIFPGGHTSEEFTDFREYFPNTVLCKAIICNQWMAESN